MAHVRMKVDTFDVEHGGRLAAGSLVEVEDADVVKRWKRNGIAADPDDPEAVAAMSQSTEALRAEIVRLQARLERGRSGEPDEARLPAEASPYGAQADELGDLGLSEQQRTNLRRAGFGTRRRIAEAREEDLLEVGGIGAATVARLREAAGEGPFGTDAAQKAITRGPGAR